MDGEFADKYAQNKNNNNGDIRAPNEPKTPHIALILKEQRSTNSWKLKM